MSEMVERVAKAIYEVTPWMGVTWTDLPSVPKDAYRDRARAAIEAMREPTPKMVEAAWADALAEDAKGVWESMVDEALK